MNELNQVKEERDLYLKALNEIMKLQLREYEHYKEREDYIKQLERVIEFLGGRRF